MTPNRSAPFARLNILLTMMSLAGMLSITSTASAQIRSEWAQFDSNYASYTTVYECRAATTRTGRIALRLEDYDTLSLQAVAAQSYVPKEAAAAVEQCLDRIVVDSLAYAELMPMVGLYLVAGRDKDAATLVERMLKGQWRSVPTDSGRTAGTAYFAGEDGNLRRAAIHNKAAMTYLNSIPVRFSAALSHLDEFEQLVPDERVALVNQYYAVFRKARELQDSAVMTRVSQRIIDIDQQLTTTQRQQVRTPIFVAMQYRAAPTRFDSLRLDSDAYVSLQKSQLYALDIHDRMLGSTMDTLAGEFRFPAAPVYPVPGKISLVMVLGPVGWSSNAVFPMLRRLKQKHPDLEILYVSQTAGQLGTTLLSPEEQAETERRWVQDVRKMPFSVLIEKAVPWRLPEPDRRLVYGTTPNSEKYKNRLWLVDRAGTIVFHSPISKEPEEELDQLITALRQQR